MLETISTVESLPATIEMCWRQEKVLEYPRGKNVLDLKHQLQEWLAEGNHITVGLDANNDVRDSPVQRMLTELGLKDAILSMHPNEIPETNYKNGKSMPTDGLFCSPGIKPEKGGFSEHKAFVDSDHRSLWLDIPFTSALGPKQTRYVAVPQNFPTQRGAWSGNP